jgi:hypothetical protein
MRTTEIPTDLLVDVHELMINRIKRAFEHPSEWDANTDATTVVFQMAEMDHLAPLMKWLEYQAAVWASPGNRALAST